MNFLVRALGAEILKTKRTLALGLALIAPLAIGFLVVAMIAQMGPRADRTDHWLGLVQNGAVLWSLLMLPLFITLEMGLLGAIEHGNQTWKMLYAQPIPRWAIYAAKQIVGLGIIALSTIVFVGVEFTAGKLLQVINPLFLFDAPFPWQTVLTASVVSFLCCWLIVSFHLWLSIRAPSFAVAMAAGIVGTIAAAVIFDSDYGPYYPWTLAGQGGNAALLGKSYFVQLIIGLAGGLLVAALGCWDATRRDVV